MNKQIDNLNLLKIASERAQKHLEDKKQKLGNEYNKIERLKSSLIDLEK